MATLISDISSAYCVPNSIKLKIDPGNCATYINERVVFRVDAPSITLHHRRVLLDASGNPLFTLRKQRATLHGRWDVFKGGNTNSTDLLFSVKRSSSMIPSKKNIDLDVFLAKNKKESVSDFKVNAGADKKSCDICANGSSTIIAKMTNSDKGTFEVDVKPNVDYAFIVALLTIVDEIDYYKLENAVKDTCKAGRRALQVMTMCAEGAQSVNEQMGDEN